MAKLELVGVGEASDLLGVSKARVHQLRRDQPYGFPEPIADLQSGPVWLRQQILGWQSIRSKQGGRPSLAQTWAFADLQAELRDWLVTHVTQVAARNSL